MERLRFNWDPEKNEENIRGHGVSFEEAKTVFYDDNAVEFYDEEHSEWEDRFLMLGLSLRMRLLLVCHCLRENDEVIRIISARKPTRKEQESYPGGKR